METNSKERMEKYTMTKCYFEIESNILQDFPYQQWIQQAVEATLLYEQCPYDTELNILITSDAEMKKINALQRKIFATTDVLSFPMLSFQTPSSFPCFDKKDVRYFNPDTGACTLGDIVLSAERAVAQAEAYGHSLKREISFLSIHSVLHLCGYDHIKRSDRSEMEQRQRMILEQLQIKRDHA